MTCIGICTANAQQKHTVIEQNGADLALSSHRSSARHKLSTGPKPLFSTTDLDRLNYFEPNDTFCFAALWKPNHQVSEVIFPTSDGKSRTFRAYGQILIPLYGQIYTLTVFEAPGLANHPLYQDLLFLPFYDDTNGDSSYGGGRYLDLSRKNFDEGNYAVDFNFCYNPYCAYSEEYSCPVPPASNRLPFAVRAGEEKFVRIGEETALEK